MNFYLEKLAAVNAPIEREGFSKRLQGALRDAKHSADSPTQLARDFNARFSGQPITVHAARKWLVGEAIPTQEKLQTLAQWLGVSTEWLRFGGDLTSITAVADGAARYEAFDLQLIADLQRLDKDDQAIARNFIRMLVRMSHKE